MREGMVMLDTIRCIVPRCRWRPSLPAGWIAIQTEKRRSSAVRQGTPEPRTSTLAEHETSGLRVGVNSDGLTWLEISIPRLLYGDNSISLTSESELVTAKAKLRDLLSEIWELNAGENEFRISRIDPVLFVSIPLADMMSAHRSSRHPLFHKLPAVYPAESLRFEGSERLCRMYSSELLKKRKDVSRTRVEWQLRRRTIPMVFREVLFLDKLTLERTYSAFRQLCLKFEVAGVPKDKSTYSLLALSELNGWSHQGISALDIYCASRRRTENSIRKKVAAFRPSIFQICWKEILPPTYGEFLKSQHSTRP